MLLFSRNKFYSRTAYSFYNAANDFSYNDLQGKKDTLAHAAVFKGGFIQDFALQLPGNQYLMASAWFQYARPGNSTDTYGRKVGSSPDGSLMENNAFMEGL